MAVDEALLRSGTNLPILRVYNWLGDWISFGYFQKYEDIAQEIDPRFQVVRRWTGGGLVDHRSDQTYTLIVPRELPIANDRPETSYRIVHEALAEALSSAGYDSSLASEEKPDAAGRCFASEGGHARQDVLVDGRKVAGAAQRRGRNGLLHQGSIKLDAPLDDSVFINFAEELAESMQPFPIDETIEKQAKQLALERYATEGWLKKR